MEFIIYAMQGCKMGFYAVLIFFISVLAKLTYVQICAWNQLVFLESGYQQDYYCSLKC